MVKINRPDPATEALVEAAFARLAPQHGHVTERVRKFTNPSATDNQPKTMGFSSAPHNPNSPLSVTVGCLVELTSLTFSDDPKVASSALILRDEMLKRLITSPDAKKPRGR